MTHPDLLHRIPPVRSESRAFSEAITFGFARGIEQERLVRLAAFPLSHSTFQEKYFSDDLFLRELITGSFPLTCSGKKLEGSTEFFRTALVAPPSELDDTHFRHEIFRELMGDEERLALVESAYLSARAFREALAGADHVQGRTVGVQRRIDIVGALKRALDDLFRATGGCRSGLSKIADWVEGVQSGESYERLRELLSFESSRSVLETKLQVGYDGTLRKFEIARVSQLNHGSFPRGPVRRFFRRAFALLKGYRFSEEDIMSQLLDRVFSDLGEEVQIVLGLSLQLEFYLRGLSFQRTCSRKGYSTSLPRVSPKGGDAQPRRLTRLFNPWLVAQADCEVVPCDLDQELAHSTVIVTGPNSGGKTRLMQSLAVTQLLAQSGLPVPAETAELVEVEQLFLSLLEHADADQTEGRLGLELLRIRQVFESSGPYSLVIMDELCSGTNPSEGTRIFEMVLELLEELGAQVLITTHFLDFAERLCESERCADFVQVELSENDLPTYQFVPGVASTSLARNTAARLGVTREELRGLILTHRPK